MGYLVKTRTLVLALLLVFLGSFAAQAAQTTDWIWTGTYMDLWYGNGSYSVDTDMDTSAGSLSNSEAAQVESAGDGSFSGGLSAYGLELGYNRQSGPWVVGLSAGIAGWDLDDSSLNRGQFSGGGDSYALDIGYKSHGFANLRSHLGLAYGNWLFEVNGGMAWINGKTEWSYTNMTTGEYCEGSQTKNKLGWTLGAAVNYAISNHWSLRFEYRYMDFGKISADGSLGSSSFEGSSKLHVHLGTIGVRCIF